MKNANYSRSLMYSVLINNTIIDSKCVNELIEAKKVSGYKDIFDLICGKIPEDGLTERTVIRLKDAASDMDNILKIYDRYEDIVRRYRIKVISDESTYYPKIWKGLTGMPKVFYLRGNEDVLTKIDESGAVSMVGSRNPGQYALYATREFASKLSRKGLVIVSGMALGVDRASHEAALDAHGLTLAVLPGGCDEIYPRENRDLYERILAEKGAVLSEMPPSAGIRKQYFPSRNRLISALSDCCLIMEAGEYSGTLHTASFAACQGREVFVLPNSIYADNCIGGLKLINDGASILLNVDDVVDAAASMLLYRKMDGGKACKGGVSRADIGAILKKIDASPEEVDDDDIKTLITGELSVRAQSCDDLCDATHVPFYIMSRVLSDMELEGKVHVEKGKFALTISH